MCSNKICSFSQKLNDFLHFIILLKEIHLQRNLVCTSNNNKKIDVQPLHFPQFLNVGRPIYHVSQKKLAPQIAMNTVLYNYKYIFKTKFSHLHLIATFVSFPYHKTGVNLIK